MATWRTRRPLCTDEIFNLARAAPNVCVLNLHGNLSILTENGQCKCLPGQMNGRERRAKQQQQQQRATAAVPPLSLSLCLHPTGQSTAVGHCTRHPATGNRHWESLMSLWAFLIRVCICVCQMLSVEQRQRLAPQLHVQHAHRPPPCTVSLPPPSLLRQCQSQPLAVQWTPMVQWAIVVIDEPTLSVAYS